MSDLQIIPNSPARTAQAALQNVNSQGIQVKGHQGFTNLYFFFQHRIIFKIRSWDKTSKKYTGFLWVGLSVSRIISRVLHIFLQWEKHWLYLVSLVWFSPTPSRQHSLSLERVWRDHQLPGSSQTLHWAKLILHLQNQPT